MTAAAEAAPIAGPLAYLSEAVAAALRPGGALAVVDVMPDERPTPRWVALYQLGLLLRTASGRVHPLAAYLSWLRDAGFEPSARYSLVARAQAVLLVARKPAGG